MLGRELSKELVLGAAEQIKQLLSHQEEENRNVVKKGLILYRQGSIYNVSTTSHSVSAKVQDVTSVQVELDLDDFSMSTCTCLSDSICRHQLATFLYVYASVDRVGTFVELWKEEKPIDDVLKHVKKASSLLKPEKDYEDTLGSWIAFFDREFERWYEQVTSPNQLFQSLFHHYYSALKKKAPKSPEMKQFFIVQASVTVFLKILQLINETKPTDYMLQHIIYPYLDQLIDNVEVAISEMKRYALPFALDPYLVDSVERFRELLFTSKEYQYERTNLYKLLWIELLRRDKFISIEREWLEEHLEEEQKQDPSFAIEFEMALMHMNFLQSRDEEIFEVMRTKLTPSALPFIFPWVEDIFKKKNWKRLSNWISYLLNGTNEYINSSLPFDEKRQTIRYLLRFISQYARATNDDVLYERACKMMLPLSYAEYHDLLLDKEAYKTWIELQTLLGFSLDEMDTYVLKEIEKSEPGVLLPLYVQSVQHEIRMKTRENYKMAVRYLKRIKAQYKKLKREEVWENYILQLAEEHKRLRAFKEELKKGKLIHD